MSDTPPASAISNALTFYKRLNRLFRSGPAIRRKVKGQDYRNFYDTEVMKGAMGYYGPSAFRRESSPFSSMGAYGILDRQSRAAEFAEMDARCAEVSTALNIYADESCASDETGQMFHVYSPNAEIQKALEELFYDVVDIEFNGRRMMRNLVKNGDYFCYVEVVPNYGVINVEPLPVNEVEREEGYDKNDPYATRFRLLTRGGKYLENWQILHMRILGSDMFLPYGMSLLESARRPWRMLTMIEDSMLLYRLVRSPERRVFYVDVSAIAPNDIPSYMEGVKEAMRGSSVIEHEEGKQDFRYNPFSALDDYFMPVRQNTNTKIESLAGAVNNTAVDDVQYILNKLIAALMVPRAYLTYDEAISSKSTLAQEDIRFSRTIATLQKIMVAELNKLAMIHLFALGFSGEDLIDFELGFSNPSTVAVQQKLALLTARIEVAGKAWELGKETGMVSIPHIQREILGFRPDQINTNWIEAKIDQTRVAELAAIAENPKFDKSEDSNIDIFDKSNYEVPGSPFRPNPDAVADVEKANVEMQQMRDAEKAAIRQAERGAVNTSNGVGGKPSAAGAPIRANYTPALDAAARRISRRNPFGGAGALHMPDFQSMLSPITRRARDSVYDVPSSKTLLEASEMLTEQVRPIPHAMNRGVRSSLVRLKEHMNKTLKASIAEVKNDQTVLKPEEDEVLLLESTLQDGKPDEESAGDDDSNILILENS